MSENLLWYTKAIYGFDHVVRLVPPGPAVWSRPSPCEGWTARHVIGHVIAVQAYIDAIVNDREPSMNPMDGPDRHAGTDPSATWAAARDAVLESLDRPGVLHRVVPYWNGPTEVDAVIGFNVVDTTIHAWDLARTVGADEHLDPGLVTRTTELLMPRIEHMRGSVGFGPAITRTTADDSALDRLLAAAGRRP